LLNQAYFRTSILPFSEKWIIPQALSAVLTKDYENELLWGTPEIKSILKLTNWSVSLK
jgi:hypothetical protein